MFGLILIPSRAAVSAISSALYTFLSSIQPRLEPGNMSVWSYTEKRIATSTLTGRRVVKESYLVIRVKLVALDGYTTLDDTTRIRTDR